MSAALPTHAHHNAPGNRRQSSHSRPSLLDRPYSPNRSEVLLPSTTYHAPVQSRSRTPSLSTGLSRIDTSVTFSPPRNRAANLQPPPNPDDFYRQFPTEPDRPVPSVSGLHQEALRALNTRDTSQSRVGSSGSYSTSWSIDDPRDTALPANIPGLRTRKASVKNLVAQINASSFTESPPIPASIHSVLSPVPAGGSAAFLTSAHASHFANGSRAHSNPTLYASGRSTDSVHSDSGNYTMLQPKKQRRPLFGEVLPVSTIQQSAGYGIVNARRRAGSESSPMHSPNPMFPTEQRDSQFVLSPTIYTSPDQRPDHRRTKSDKPDKASHPVGIPPLSGPPIPPTSEHRPLITSRIPVSTHVSNATSESGGSASNSRATPSSDRPLPKFDIKKPSGRSSNARQSLTIEHLNTTRITSPGRSVPPGAKSPSLRAKIIVPPPKISPPLRSSRPRMTVSNASTAASRARMAEKFNSMQKMNSEKRAIQRRPAKPPELTDIDFVERRSRITRALTKSKERDESKPSLATNKKWAASRSQTSSPHLNGRAQTDAAPNYSHNDGDVMEQDLSYVNTPSESGQDREQVMRGALHMMQIDNTRRQDSEDIDSPTLGHDAPPFDPLSMHLQTSFLTPHDDMEPQSAVTDMTVESEATHIDPEPQDERAVDRPSILNHVIQLRERSLSNTYEPQRATVDYSDRTDVESVNLVFRNTAYLDDDEAISKGYRPNFASQEPLPEEDDEHFSHRDSWTSSLPDGTEQGEEDHTAIPEQELDGQEDSYIRDGGFVASTHYDQHESYRNTMASDAYTIVNIVLQQHSSSGVVDQQFADDVYQKVLESCPEAEDDEALDSEHIQQLCLQELVRRDATERHHDTSTEVQGMSDDTDHESTIHDTQSPNQNRMTMDDAFVAPDYNLLTLPTTTYGGHRHKSSLDSAEDFASTSPSISDWMRYAASSPTPPNGSQQADLTMTHAPRVDDTVAENEPDASNGIAVHKQDSSIIRYEIDQDTLEPEEYGTAIIRAPSRSPPPPPKDNLPSIEKVSRTLTEDGTEWGIPKPLVPHRVASLGQASSRSQSVSRPPSTRSRADVTPWEVQDLSEEVVSPEVRRLKKRRHILKELVDTEFTYQRDMRVLCDIYKQTATAALSEDDIKVLFGNVEEVQQFARDFLIALKQASKPSYMMERSERKKDKKDGVDNLMHANSSSSTLASNTVEIETSDIQKDRETKIGEAFEASLSDMEAVYTEYIRNRHAANQRLEALQKLTAAEEWLKECRDNSSDITNAWNLDALLVKPVQRITKYPLLLRELIDATVQDHPDLATLRKVMNNVTDINMRINEHKKHAEMLDQVLNRKRGQSDVRAGLSKAFGRRAEKLRQHVGITDMYEDTDYDKLRIAYDNNYVQLMVVANDCQSYEKGITQWVSRMVEFAAAVEGWLDVGHSHHQQEESKLRHLAMIIRNVHNIALPDHLEHLQKKVIQPMTKTVETLQRFKDEPKGLLQKRDKRLVDYAQMKNKKERGERIDKKMGERMDQWEALNTEAKERMKKLLTATAHLVQSCQGHLVQLQMSWMAMMQQKLSNVMGINLKRLSVEEIEKDWQVDFDFQEASALALGICNGSLVLQAANMTSFLTPGSTLTGDDSPRQMSFSSTNKRSVSLNSEASNVASLDFSSRPSGTYTHTHGLPESHFDRPYPYPNGRTRAASTTSGKSLRNVDTNVRAATVAKHTSASANFARPGTSPALHADGFVPPRLSVETHSPLMPSFPSGSGGERPVSSSTFFSASGGPSQPPAAQRSRGSGVFTSALPMSDSPVVERHAVETPQTPLSEPQVLFTAASLYEFNIDRALREAGFPYLTYVTGEIFDVLGERGELWLAKNQDDPHEQVGWIWNKHFAKLAE